MHGPTSQDLITELGTKLVLAKAAVDSLVYFAKISLPAAREVAHRMADWSAWRKNNADAFFAEFYSRVNPLAGEPRAVAPRFLIEVVDHASEEESADLRSMWASLLASTVDAGGPTVSYFGFADVLRQLTPEEARVLAMVYEAADPIWIGVVDRMNTRGARLRESDAFEPWSVSDVVFWNLCRLQLLAPQYDTMDAAGIWESLERGSSSKRVVSEEPSDFGSTFYGEAFMKACNRPAVVPEADRKDDVSESAGSTTKQ